MFLSYQKLLVSVSRLILGSVKISDARMYLVVLVSMLSCCAVNLHFVLVI